MPRRFIHERQRQRDVSSGKSDICQEREHSRGFARNGGKTHRLLAAISPPVHPLD